MELNTLSHQILGCAFRVHTKLGPGLLESTYEVCLAHELQKVGIHFERQRRLPVIYDDLKLEEGYRIDLLVENRIILEIKSVDAVAPIHKAQLLTYLKLSQTRLGLLLNFNVQHLKDGISRVILKEPDTQGNNKSL